jgi:hypothetical protein
VSKAITATQKYGGSAMRDLRRARLGDEYRPTGQDDPNGESFAAKKLGWTPDGDRIPTQLTPDAERWQGWGTAMKPSHEPIVCARRPLVGTVAANVQRFGTGALNIDGCRIGSPVADSERRASPRSGQRGSGFAMAATDEDERHNPSGRWPANTILVHSDLCVRVGTRRVKGASGWSETGSKASENRAMSSPNQERAPGPDAFMDADGMEETEVWECVPQCPVRQLDEQSGNVKGYTGQVHREGTRSGSFVAGQHDGGAERVTNGYGDKGGASRFFATFQHSEPRFRYCAKASTRERSAGLPEGERNIHPTCKPIGVMRWLIRLVCPPGGTILDPFLGSGTTGCAAMLEPCVGHFIGIEQDAEYANIARARIGWWQEHGEDALKAAPKTGKRSVDV